MSRIFYRPMFRTGGSSNSGITSGLRQRYDMGKRVVDLRQQMADAGIKARDPKQNFYNLNFRQGLSMTISFS